MDKLSQKNRKQPGACVDTYVDTPTESEVLRNFRETRRDGKPEGTMIAILLVSGLAFVAYFIHEMLSPEPSQNKVIAGAIVWGVLMAGGYFLFNRCSKCGSRLLHIANTSNFNERYVVCRSCKTFYREMVPDSGV